MSKSKLIAISYVGNGPAEVNVAEGCSPEEVAAELAIIASERRFANLMRSPQRAVVMEFIDRLHRETFGV